MWIEFSASIDGVARRRCAVKIRSIGINYPFGYIAIHVVQPPGVGLFGSYLLGGLLAIGCIPSIVSQDGRLGAKENRSSDPALAAYSHSASVGSR